MGELTTLVQEAQAGDTKAFGRLCAPETLDRWLVLINHRLPRYLLRKVDPADVLQEALADAWQSLAAFKGCDSQSFQRWMAGIIRHRITDTVRFYHRQQRAIEREGSQSARLSGIARSEHTPFRSLVRREQAAEAAVVFGRLRELHCEIICLRILEGYSSKETAELTGLSVQNVDVTLHRALKRLGELLAAEHLDTTIFRPLRGC